MAKTETNSVSRGHPAFVDWKEMASSQNPNDRFIAALDGHHLDILIHDECWLVRHEARRSLQRKKLEQNGELDDKETFNFYNEPVLDISDVAYQLHMRLEIMNFFIMSDYDDAAVEWGRDALHAFRRNAAMYSFDIWLADRFSDSEHYLTHGMFCGFGEPGCQGIYHDRNYISALFNDDEVLLALYDADINDDYEHQHNLDGVLANAQERSGSVTNQNDNSKVKSKMTAEPTK